VGAPAGHPDRGQRLPRGAERGRDLQPREGGGEADPAPGGALGVREAPGLHRGDRQVGLAGEARPEGVGLADEAWDARGGRTPRGVQEDWRREEGRRVPAAGLQGPALHRWDRLRGGLPQGRELPHVPRGVRVGYQERDRRVRPARGGRRLDRVGPARVRSLGRSGPQAPVHPHQHRLDPLLQGHEHGSLRGLPQVPGGHVLPGDGVRRAQGELGAPGEVVPGEPGARGRGSSGSGEAGQLHPGERSRSAREAPGQDRRVPQQADGRGLPGPDPDGQLPRPRGPAPQRARRAPPWQPRRRPAVGLRPPRSGGRRRVA